MKRGRAMRPRFVPVKFAAGMERKLCVRSIEFD